MRRTGFSLIEVNLAILLVALGMLALFGLFPSGLREGEASIRDTHAALFADFVFSSMQGKASEVASWQTWNNLSSFRNAMAISGPIPVRHTGDNISGAVEFPQGSGDYIRYILNISGHDGHDNQAFAEGRPQPALRRKASLWVWSGRYSTEDRGSFRRNSEWFYTEFVYTGM